MQHAAHKQHQEINCPTALCPWCPACFPCGPSRLCPWSRLTHVPPLLTQITAQAADSPPGWCSPFFRSSDLWTHAAPGGVHKMHNKPRQFSVVNHFMERTFAHYRHQKKSRCICIIDRLPVSLVRRRTPPVHCSPQQRYTELIPRSGTAHIFEIKPPGPSQNRP